MCGIIGFTGNEPARDIIINGLEQLEYRGLRSEREQERLQS